MLTSANAANPAVAVIDASAFDAEPKFFACLVRFVSSPVPTTLPTAYDVYPLHGRQDGGCYTVKDCGTIGARPRTPGARSRDSPTQPVALLASGVVAAPQRARERRRRQLGVEQQRVVLSRPGIAPAVRVRLGDALLGCAPLGHRLSVGGSAR